MNKKPYKKGSNGFKFILIFIGIVVLGGMLFANGAFPSFEKSIPLPLNPDSELQTPNASSGQSNLQLQTFGFKDCGKLVAIDLLVDSSGSMGSGSKMLQLQNGLREMTSQYPDNGVIGMQMFNAPDYTPPNGAKELVPISLYKNVKSQISSAINGLIPNGATYSKNAFEFVRPKLQAAKTAFPDYKINLIFVSDGVPEAYSPPNPPPPGPGRFNPVQDPSSVAQLVKSDGIRIFSIAYLDQTDQTDNTKLEQLMTNVASSADDFYKAPTSNEITSILKQITAKICKQ